MPKHTNAHFFFSMSCFAMQAEFMWEEVAESVPELYVPSLGSREVLACDAQSLSVWLFSEFIALACNSETRAEARCARCCSSIFFFW